MQIIKSIIAVTTLVAPVVMAVNIGDGCNRNIEKDYTACDNGRTNIIYCDPGSSKWTWAYTCNGGCCRNNPPRFGGGSYASCGC
ncbi:hypothetical protein BBAD15_g4905 [Beauveria bassiana D1-5]|uniref:Uncharacterized protein n=1 Tax=Beauveria bassiana D1-5 TaxID=1245745 RepID=A0A0A2VQ98_BEABA|nr:hypothetical protein BBAD15_g4905 [Beauveria bassiana D1-5]